MCYNMGTVEKGPLYSSRPHFTSQRGGYAMAISKAQQKAVNKYVRENYDRVNVNMPKGQKDVIKSHAESRGESLNAFINRAILETMERENTPATSE